MATCQAPLVLCSPDITRCPDGCQSGNPNHYLVPATGVNTNLTKLPNENHRLIYHQEDFQEDSKGCLGARIRRCTRTDGQERRTGEEAVRAATGYLACEDVNALCFPGSALGKVTNRDAAQDGWRSGLQTVDNTPIQYIENRLTCIQV